MHPGLSNVYKKSALLFLRASLLISREGRELCSSVPVIFTGICRQFWQERLTTMTAPLPDTEDARLAALRQCRMLDTAPDADFDDITRLAAHVCGVPIAAVSLIDTERQWFKSILGLDTRETPRDVAFCAHTILQPNVLEVPDAWTDERFADNPLVTGDPNIRFYAGAPLITSDGHALGSLCVIDRVPRHLTDDQRAALRVLARQAVSQLEMASRLAEQERLMAERAAAEQALRESKQFIESITDHSTSIIFVFDLETMVNIYSNRNVGEFLGYTTQQVQDMGDALLPMMLHPDDLSRVQSHFAEFADKADGEVVEIEYRARHADGVWRWIWNREVVFKRRLDGMPCQIMGTAHDVTERRQAQEETARLAAIVESSRDAILGMTLDGTLVSWNAAAEGLYGYREAEVIGQHASVLAPPAERGFIGEAIRAVLAGEKRENIEAKRRRKDGTWLDVSLTFSPIKSLAGKVIGIGAIVRDITAHKQAEEALRRSEETLRAVMEGAPIVLYATDSEGVVTLSEGAGLERLGLAPGEVVGRSVFEMYHDAPDIADNLRRALLGEAVSYDAQVNALYYHNEVMPQRNESGTIIGLIGVGHDVTERLQAEQTLKDFSVVLEFQKEQLERANAELASLATLDGLTGLRNRRAFDERLGEEFERASRYHKPLSLLLLDIDFFKQYNDTFGHQAGDEVLRMIGRTLQKATRDTDYPARYGGEEFAVILPETDGDGAMQVAERVCAAVATTSWENREITASLGVCTLRLGMEQAAELVSCADLALYQSKAEGRNRVTRGYGPSIDAVPACQIGENSPLPE